MPELTHYEVDVLTLLSSRLPEGQRNALIEIPELQRHMPYATEDEVVLALTVLDARGLIRYSPPVIAGMAGIVARPSAPRDAAELRPKRHRRKRAHDAAPRGA
jgi:hypothetical protein